MYISPVDHVIVANSVRVINADDTQQYMYIRPSDGASENNLNRLQVAPDSLARVVCQPPRSATVLLPSQQLHWLPVRQRIAYKLAVITCKICWHSGLPISPHPRSSASTHITTVRQIVTFGRPTWESDAVSASANTFSTSLLQSETHCHVTDLQHF